MTLKDNLSTELIKFNFCYDPSTIFEQSNNLKAALKEYNLPFERLQLIHALIDERINIIVNYYKLENLFYNLASEINSGLVAAHHPIMTTFERKQPTTPEKLSVFHLKQLVDSAKLALETIDSTNTTFLEKEKDYKDYLQAIIKNYFNISEESNKDLEFYTDIIVSGGIAILKRNY